MQMEGVMDSELDDRSDRGRTSGRKLKWGFMKAKWMMLVCGENGDVA